MKKLALLTFTGLASTMMATPEKESFHNLSTHIQYKRHKESNYNYNEHCLGLGYDYLKDSGLNLRFRTFSNLKTEGNFSESNVDLFYKFNLDDINALYPILNTFGSYHHVNTKGDHLYFIQKASIGLGLGWECNADEMFGFSLEVMPFTDTANNYMVVHQNEFIGKTYSNPSGMQGRFNFFTKIEDFLRFDGALYGKRTFKKAYFEYGFEVAIKGVF